MMMRMTFFVLCRCEFSQVTTGPLTLGGAAAAASRLGRSYFFILRRQTRGVVLDTGTRVSLFV
jgi:hypothetical protein